LIAQTNCPWILSNLLETEKGNRPISGVEPCRIVEHQGFKIGCIGFSDEAWTDQFNPDINCDILKYVDYNESLRKYSKILKEQGADLIIALNHMRKPEDLDMAQ
jgi:2',3'-cyclic-nucleotide 2'-phosphodiesterase (5'-nucleotidase family)